MSSYLDSGDKPLADALALLLNEGVSSLAVIDNSSNVVGNISVVDVKLLTNSSSLPLLRNTCIHFVSYILSNRGMENGKDSVPVFHITPMNTLAHIVAKLVATKSHRLWVTEPISPSSSGPPTPSLNTATLVPTMSHSSSSSGQHYHVPPPALSADPGSVADASPKTPLIAPTGPSISASALPGARISGHLCGVVSLTDILILFARVGGLEVADPQEIRARRRRSSSSSQRPSMDLGVRPSIDLGVRSRPSMDLQRKPSGGH
jgi:CBS domain-containing protein